MAHPLFSAAEDYRKLKTELAELYQREKALTEELDQLNDRISAKLVQVDEAEDYLLQNALA